MQFALKIQKNSVKSVKFIKFPLKTLKFQYLDAENDNGILF